MNSSPKINTDFLLAPITSLSFIGDYVLAGEGPFLKIYDISSGQLVTQKDVLGAAVIHGICIGANSQVVVYGQKSLCVVSVQTCADHVKVSIDSDVCELSDWIWDICWLQPSTQLGIVLAHNSIVRWDWKERLVLQHVHCEENCILYCALLIGSRWDDLIVAAGTVFNQVVLWKPSSVQNSQRCPVYQTFAGHEGVIFNINYHAGRGQLCSVSDDRSIRLWPMDGETKDYETKEASLVLYGHAARVWDCQLLDDIIVSIGEDATCKVWNYDGDVLHTFTGHKGCSIWSLAVDGIKRILATGGGDSSIRLWRLNDQQQHETSSTTNLVTLSHDLVMKSGLGTTHNAELINGIDMTPKHVTVAGSGEVLVMTQCGALLGYQSSKQGWRCLMYDSQYQNYAILAVSPDSKMAALGNLQGKVRVLQIDAEKEKMSEKHVYSSKLFNVIWATSQDLFTSGPDGHLDWITVNCEADNIILTSKAKFILPPARQHWATAVTLLSEEEIICGDRRGSVHLFRYAEPNDLGDDSHDTEKMQSYQPWHSLFGIHGKTGVTSLCTHNRMLYSTGRDGTYRQYLVSDNEIHMLNTFKVNKGFQWLEKIIFSGSEEIQVLGFHTNQFIVWSVSRSEKQLEVECGGGHRTWGYSTHNGTATFACVKAQQVFIHKSPWLQGRRQSIIKPALHGHQVTCVKYLASIPSSSTSDAEYASSTSDAEYAVCATGSEDTTVNIIMMHLNSAKPSHVKILHRLQAHISRVCALTSCPSVLGDREASSGRSVLLFSVGGRCALQCWRVSLEKGNNSSPEVICQVEHLVSHGTVDGVERRRLLKKSADLVDPETRYMDVTVWRDSCVASNLLIGVAGSDACVRLFALDESKRKLQLQCVTPHHDACVLSVRNLNLSFADYPTTLMLTAATNGHILLWDSKQTLVSKSFGKPLVDLQHHQSGINCLSCICLHDDTFLVASGGDDNGLCISVIRVCRSEHGGITLSCVNTNKVDGAHATQILGIQLISSNCLVTASVDQRVNLWNVDVSLESSFDIKVTMCGSKFTHIADTSCMDSWTGRSGKQNIVISGQGVQVLHIDHEDHYG